MNPKNDYPGAEHKHYWNNVAQRATVEIVTASTNEPFLRESLEVWRNQTYQDLHVTVVVDHVEPETWSLAKDFSKDPRFTFVLSPQLRGLARAWNLGLSSDSDYVGFTGADYLYPTDYVETCVRILKDRPEYGILIPSSEGQPDQFPPWSHFATRDCIRKTGLLTYDYGLGGLGMIRDWRRRALQQGFKPKAMRHVYISGTEKNYSIQNGAFDETRTSLDIIEGTKETVVKGLGNDVMWNQFIIPEDSLEFVDNQGIIVDSLTDVMSSEQAKQARVNLEVWKKRKAEVLPIVSTLNIEEVVQQSQQTCAAIVSAIRFVQGKRPPAGLAYPIIGLSYGVFSMEMSARKFPPETWGKDGHDAASAKHLIALRDSYKTFEAAYYDATAGSIYLGAIFDAILMANPEPNVRQDIVGTMRNIERIVAYLSIL